MNSYKKCIGDCKKTKPITDFWDAGYIKKDGTKSKASKCKACLIPIKNAKRRKIKEKQIKKFKPNTIKCTMCNYSKETHLNFSIEAIQFHHIEDNKLFNVSDMFGVRKDKYIQEEIKKCILLCVRCHAEITANERKGNS
tara:strand:- start:862 stop:1278 length:417 start_codon:yes stop_codon:yes gene_type:complete